MTAEECIERFRAKPSTKYTDRYDVDGGVNLIGRNLTQLPIAFSVITEWFWCSNNQLTNLKGAPKRVGGFFNCTDNQLTDLEGAPKWVGDLFNCNDNRLTTLDHLPKHIGGNLYCQNNLLKNLNGLKDVTIEGSISFSYTTEDDLDYWLKALYNTNLDTLEYHYDNHRYDFWKNSELKNYVMNELEEIIKLKRLKRDLNI